MGCIRDVRGNSKGVWALARAQIHKYAYVGVCWPSGLIKIQNQWSTEFIKGLLNIFDFTLGRKIFKFRGKFLAKSYKLKGQK